MADESDKSSGDLDVFEGLTRKSQPPASGNVPPPPSSIASSGTLRPGAPSIPAPPGSRASAIPPPPGSRGSVAPPLPPPPGAARASQPAVPPPPSGPPAPPKSTPPPLPPGAARASSPGLSPPPPPPPPLPAPPPAAGAAITTADAPSTIKDVPPAPPTAPTAAAAPPSSEEPEENTAPGEIKPRAVDMVWEDDEESTHVYSKDSHDLRSATAGPRPAAGTPAPAAVAPVAAHNKTTMGMGAAVPPPPGSVRPGGLTPPPASVRPGTGLTPPPGSARPPAPSTPPAIPPASSPVRTIPQPSSPPMPSGALATKVSIPAQAATPARPSPGPSRGKGVLALAVAALLAVAGIALYPRTGALQVDMKLAPGAEPVARAEVFVDGQKQCDAVPCVVSGLAPGMKTVRIIPAGEKNGPSQSVEVVSGKQALAVLTIEPPPAPPAPKGPIFKVGAMPAGVTVSVGGVNRGSPPLELTDLAPGTHAVVFDGGERYERLERAVDVKAGEVSDLGSPQLKVLKGAVTFQMKTPGAVAILVRTDGKPDRRALPAAGATLAISAADGWKVIAKKPGFETFEQDIRFDDGVAEKTIVVELTPTQAAAPAAAPVTPAPAATPAPVAALKPAQTTERQAPPQRATEKPEPAEEAPKASGGEATLSMNSIPVSKVILDGRPLGSTPKLKVSVSPGSHTVTFVHPEHGKKSKSVTVSGGESKTVVHKF